MSRRLLTLLAWSSPLLAISCDFGGGIAGVDSPATVPLAIAPTFAVTPKAGELEAVDLLRLTVRDARDGAALIREERPVGPGEAKWRIELTAEVPVADPALTAIYVETELVSTGGGGSAEWSGHTETFPLVLPDGPLEARQILLYRGPLANLQLTGVTLTRPVVRLVDGATSTLGWKTEGDSTGTVLYFEVDDDSVATVDSTGLVSSKGIGTTQVHVFGGEVEDSALVEVTEVVLPPPAVIEGEVGPPLIYAASDLFISSFSDAAGADALQTALAELITTLLGGDGPGAVAAFEASKTAWSTYAVGTTVRYTDAAQLDVIELTLQRVANRLDTAFP